MWREEETGAVQLELPPQGFDDGYVSVQGARVHYLHAGSGRPMVLIHGLVGSAANWRRNIPALSGEASVYAVDLVNMGKSERVAGLDASLEATADRVAAFMEALGLAQADIVGHSHGGAVALMLAARHPRRVRSLILFAPVNPYSDLDHFLVRFYSTLPGRLLARAAPFVPARIQRYALERMYGDPSRIAEGSLAGYTDGLKVPGTVEHILAIVRGWFAGIERLKAVLPSVAAVPTLLVWGDRDGAVDASSAMQLQRILWQSELRILRGGGHVVFEEMPAESDRTMLEWLRREMVSNPRAASMEIHSASHARHRKRPASVAAAANTSAAI
jgi:pimeloyl-ACP methyl ester carboxylesterase